MNALQTITPQQQTNDLKQRLDAARFELATAERLLAEEQAAVNQFRMHCRLKIGEWVDRVLELRAERESLIAQLQINRMAVEVWGGDDDEAHEEYWEFDEWLHGDDLILPTESARDKAAEKALYRQLVKKFHPDLAAAGAERAYATTMMSAINSAWEKQDMAVLRNLAGDLDPDLVKELTGGDTAEIRRLRKYLLNCKRRKMRVAEQAQTLKTDNTTRLWRKAHRLEEKGLVWWEAVRKELESEASRLTPEIDMLRMQAAASEQR